MGAEETGGWRMAGDSSDDNVWEGKDNGENKAREQWRVWGEVGVHQGSILCPLLFVAVMDVLTQEVRDCLLWELLYADDLVLMATWEHRGTEGERSEMERVHGGERDEGEHWQNKGDTLREELWCF